MCEECLPLIIDHVRSLCLSTGEDTPRLYEILVLYHLTVDEFINLRALTLYKIDSADTILEIASDCFYLPHLTDLKFIECRYSKFDKFKELITNVWNLYKLSLCTFDFIVNDPLNFCQLIAISRSIRYLCIQKHAFSSTELGFLLMSIPYVQHLSIEFGQSTDHDLERIPVCSSMKTLKLCFNGTLLALTSILQKMASITKLKIDTDTINIDGNQWQKILVDYLPNIQTFRFFMKFSLDKVVNTIEHLERLLETFQTSFWLDEHRWYVRCDWPQHTTKICFVYTLPYSSNDIHTVHQNQWSKSTCANIDDYHINNHVQNVFYRGYAHDLGISPIVYSNIQQLTLMIPFDINFRRIVSTFDSLKSLKIIQRRKQDLCEIQMKYLLGQMPRLESLTIDAELFFRLIESDITHGKLHRIYLQHHHNRYDVFMDTKEYTTFVNSALGHQCQWLEIIIDDRSKIIYLATSMRNLHVLTIKSSHSFLSPRLSSKETDQLMEYLQRSLPTTYSISQHEDRIIRIWTDR